MIPAFGPDEPPPPVAAVGFAVALPPGVALAAVAAFVAAAAAVAVAASLMAETGVPWATAVEAAEVAVAATAVAAGPLAGVVPDSAVLAIVAVGAPAAVIVTDPPRHAVASRHSAMGARSSPLACEFGPQEKVSVPSAIALKEMTASGAATAGPKGNVGGCAEKQPK